VWNVTERQLIVRQPLGQCALSAEAGGAAVRIERLELTEEGARPLITLSNRHTFLFDHAMQCWLRVTDPFFARSEFASALPSQSHPGPLAELQSRAAQQQPQIDFSATGSRAETISHLENQMACAFALQSPIEYKHWLLAYVRRLGADADTNKLTELCDSLLGSPHTAGADLLILGMSKRSLLREVLPIMSQTRLLQRLVANYKEQLDEIEQGRT